MFHSFLKMPFFQHTIFSLCRRQRWEILHVILKIVERLRTRLLKIDFFTTTKRWMYGRTVGTRRTLFLYYTRLQTKQNKNHKKKKQRAKNDRRQEREDIYSEGEKSVTSSAKLTIAVKKAFFIESVALAGPPSAIASHIIWGSNMTYRVWVDHQALTLRRQKMPKPLSESRKR